ncbi:MAG TPA: hypothetical protein VHJ17_09555, partial [Thermomonospora sp.]|nr:hypothetical protein [Thermomonospora sp.]
MATSPMPSPEMVDAARAHLTGRYAKGVDRVLWDTDNHPLHDLDAIRAVLAEAHDTSASGPDLAAALVLVQAARLTVDRLEADVMQAARGAGLQWDQIAVVLGLPDPATARRQFQARLARRTEPNPE